MIKYVPFDGTKFTEGLDNTNKKFQVGKSWYIDMLRRKSDLDLEKLWYSLLREKLAIQSDKYALTQKNLRIRDEVTNAYSKICVSMSRIKTVFGERQNINNEFNMLLEYWYIRNKQMTKDKFELNKDFIRDKKSEVYIRSLIEDPKNKNILLNEIKLLEREKNLQLQRTKENVIQEKKKEIKKLKEEIQENVLREYIKNFERNKAVMKLEGKKNSELNKLKAKFNELQKNEGNDSELNNKTTEEKSLEIKTLNKKMNKLIKKEIQNKSSILKLEKLGSKEKYKEIAPDKEELQNDSNDKNKAETSDLVSFKNNPSAKNNTSDLQKQKVKKGKKVAENTGPNIEEENQPEEKENITKEDFSSIPLDVKSDKIDIESFKKTINRQQRKELTDKIKDKLRGKITRLGTKYRAILFDSQKITLRKVAPYRRRLYDELKNLDDITKVGLEYKCKKPNILAPIKLNVNHKKYQDILVGNIKAPVPYKKVKTDLNDKHYSVLSRKEISTAKSLIRKKNKNQILSGYINNYEYLSKQGKISAYNQIQKNRSKQAKNIFLKELSALKHHMKQPQSFYQKYTKKNENIEEIK